MGQEGGIPRRELGEIEDTEAEEKENQKTLKREKRHRGPWGRSWAHRAGGSDRIKERATRQGTECQKGSLTSPGFERRQT